MKNIRYARKSEILFWTSVICAGLIWFGFFFWFFYPKAFQKGNPDKAAQNYCASKNGKMCEVLDCSWVTKRCDIREGHSFILNDKLFYNETEIKTYDCRGSTCTIY